MIKLEHIINQTDIDFISSILTRAKEAPTADEKATCLDDARWAITHMHDMAKKATHQDGV